MTENNGLVDSPVKLTAFLAVLAVIGVGLMMCGEFHFADAYEGDIVIDEYMKYDVRMGVYDWTVGETYEVDLSSAVADIIDIGSAEINTEGLPSWMAYDSGKITAQPTAELGEWNYWIQFRNCDVNCIVQLIGAGISA